MSVLHLLASVILRWLLFCLTLVLLVVGLQWIDNQAHAAPVGLDLSNHQVVRSSVLPVCDTEDYPTNTPCTWNVNGGGNGRGLAYWFDTRPHYVWATHPLHGRWRWVPGYARQLLANDGIILSVSCMWRADGGYHMVVRCANGNRHRVLW